MNKAMNQLPSIIEWTYRNRYATRPVERDPNTGQLFCVYRSQRYNMDQQVFLAGFANLINEEPVWTHMVHFDPDSNRGVALTSRSLDGTHITQLFSRKDVHYTRDVPSTLNLPSTTTENLLKDLQFYELYWN